MTSARIEDIVPLAQAFGADMGRVEGDVSRLDAAVGQIEPNVRKITTDAAREPLPTDNAAEGYRIGSRWLW